MDTNNLNDLLDDIAGDVKGVIGSLLTSTDGVNIASQMMEGYEGDIDRLSAMAASSFSIGKRISQENNQKDLHEVTARSSEGYVTLIGIGTNAILCCVASRQAIIGQLLVKMMAVAEKLNGLIETMTAVA